MSVSALGGRLAILPALALLAWGCAGAPPAHSPVPGAPLPRVGAPPDPHIPTTPEETVPAPAWRTARFVRVLLTEPRESLVLEGDVRIWGAEGALIAERSGRVVLSAAGTGIRIGGERAAGASIDAAGAPEVRLAGHRVRGRIRIAARQGTLLAVAVVPLEEYVAAVLSKEMPASFRQEALKAVAVTARTYARGSLGKPRDPLYDVVSDVEDQVFEAGSGDTGPFAAAVVATRGEVLVYGGALARTVYHSTCGGSTESAAGAWGNDFPYLRSVSCGGNCRHSPAWRWEHLMPGPEGRRIARMLGVQAGSNLEIAIVARTASGRASRILLSAGGVSREASAALFRKTAGYSLVKSLKAEIRPMGDGWLFRGEGYGHGVGLCQWGAEGMARSGSGYRDILAHYYPGTSLSWGEN
jgi:stage II sporulation protein D